MKARFAYTGIRVKDLEQTVRFYTTVLGMVERGRSTTEGAKGVVLDLVSEEGGHPLELNFYERGSPFGANYEVGEGIDPLGFRVDDLDRAVAEANRAGHPVVQEMRSATSRWVYVQDPNGVWIERFA